MPSHFAFHSHHILYNYVRNIVLILASWVEHIMQISDWCDKAKMINLIIWMMTAIFILLSMTLPLWQVLYCERLNGHYGVAVFILSNFLSSFPLLVVVVGTSGPIIYFMVKFTSDFSHYAYSVLNLLGCIAVIESLMMIVPSLVPNFLMGIITGAGIMVKCCL